MSTNANSKRGSDVLIVAALATGATYDDAAKAAGVSRATFYFYFRDKQHVFLQVVRATLFSRYQDEGALKLLDEPVHPMHSYKPLVQISESPSHLEETRA